MSGGLSFTLRISLVSVHTCLSFTFTNFLSGWLQAFDICAIVMQGNLVIMTPNMYFVLAALSQHILLYQLDAHSSTSHYFGPLS